MLKLMIILILLSAISNQTAGQQLETVELTKPVTVLGDESRGSILTMPTDLVAGHGDTLYVLDGRDQVVVAFDLKGNELFRFGRDGAGPGEFRQPMEIAFTGHSIVVSDRGLSRIEEFNTDGTYLRTIKLNVLPRFGLAADNKSIFVGVIAQDYLILQIPLENPANQIPFLTFEHPELSDIVPEERTTYGWIELGMSQNGLLVAFPALGSFMVIPWNEDPNKVNIIEPACDLLAEEWKRIPELRREAQRMGGDIIPQMFNNISDWSDGKILLEVRTGRAETFRAVAVIVDAISGEELGPRFTAKQPKHGKLYLLGSDYIAWLNWGESTVSIFRSPF